MSILALRQTPYPGSEITIEETLERGANYSRYYASYLSEGLKIYGLLTIPDGEMPAGGWPAIVFNHGYIPPDVYRTTERYIAYVDSLARNGYIVFRIDYRGHDRSEGRGQRRLRRPRLPGGCAQCGGIAASATRRSDPQRIGMWGHSMGGYLTLRAMVVSPDIQAGVIWAGVVGSYPDMLNRWRRSAGLLPPPTPGAAPLAHRLGGSSTAPRRRTPQFWNAVSANSYLAEMSGPVQLHHGTADETFRWSFPDAVRADPAGRPAG